MITNKFRKTAHILLFVVVLLVQLLIYWFWHNQNKTQSTLKQSFENTKKQNLSYHYCNEINKNYFNAENSFLNYLHHYDAPSLTAYQHSLEQMTVYIDSLNTLIKVNKNFNQNLDIKVQKEKEIIRLQQELDDLIQIRIAPLEENSLRETYIKPYDYAKVLNSISYDSIQISEESEKKGLFSRLGDAISGKENIKHEQLKIYMKMRYGNVSKYGNVEDQMRNIFKSTSTHYEQEFKKLRKTYSDLRSIDQQLLEINKKIVNNTQEIILMHNLALQENDRRQFEMALADLESRRILIIYLLAAMGICTILLLFYTISAYFNEKKLAQAKETAENNAEFKNRLIGMLSHEMRAPLSIISNITHKLKSTSAAKTESDSINLLNFTSNSLQITVNQILDFFKNENGKLTLYNSAINLKSEIGTILESLKSLTEAKNLDFITNVDANLNQEVWADNGKIHQLFYNLIGNAIKFTSAGSITVTCNLTNVGEKFRLDVAVKDTGKGIPKQDLEKIFEKYYQSKNTKEQISFGAGLGLHLCKEIVELHQGEISVTSEINQGTQVSFYVLLDKVGDHESSETILRDKFENRAIKVALVDDDALVIAVLKKILTNVNFEVFPFRNVKSVKDFLSEQTVDMLITDMQIGSDSGIELIKTIKSFDNKNATIPVIAITGDVYMESVDLATINANEIVVKPINKEEIYNKILKILN